MEFSREGVTLRPPTEDDCQFLADLGNNMKTQGWNQRLPPIRVPEIISERMKEGLKKPYKAMLMIDTDQDGTVGYINYDEEKPRLGATLGLIIGEDYWGKGYAQIATEIVLEFLFEERGLKVVSAWSQSGNVRAVGAAEKMGFKVSVRVREGTIMYGQLHDTLCLDMLREEYYESRGKEDKIGSC
ncbi:MAG: GNAT family N-acetyltransferase [Thermoplasmata archaeon]|nr:GNAT family N-acetyltransferase [Thermoplasmata archaeon]